MSTITVETTVHPDHTMIALAGEVDRTAALALAELAMKCLADPATRLVVIDMAQVTLMNSIALRALVQLRSAAIDLKKELLLSHLPNRVQRLLDITEPWAAGTGFESQWTESDNGQARCLDADVDDGGRCQLQSGHREPHAASVGDAYLTWGRSGAHGWSIHVPPGWLTDLAWVTGFQPGAPLPAL